MLSIIAPEINVKEHEYIFSVIFKEFLDIPYKVQYENRNHYTLRCEKSDFLLQLPIGLMGMKWDKDAVPKLPLSYISLSQIGLERGEVKHDLLPVFFGNSKYIEEIEEVQIGFDIFGTVFFFLSRFEEVVTPYKDQHERFPGSESLCFKSGLMERPVVDEYIVVLRWLLKKINITPNLLKNYSTLDFSCDVDEPFDATTTNFSSLARACVGDIIKRKQPALFLNRIARYIARKRDQFHLDPKYTFDWYIDLCREYKIKASFYFIPDSSQPNNGCYSVDWKCTQRLIRKLIDNGHMVQCHSIYQSYNSEVVLGCGRERMAKAIAAAIEHPYHVFENRQHYLRWDSRITPDLLERAGFSSDSSGGFPDVMGFRFGTSKEFTMWGWSSNSHLKIKQKPLLVMDGTLFEHQYMGLSLPEARKKVFDIVDEVIFHNSRFSFLWHNSYNLESHEYRLFVRDVFDYYFSQARRSYIEAFETRANRTN